MTRLCYDQAMFSFGRGVAVAVDAGYRQDYEQKPKFRVGQKVLWRGGFGADPAKNVTIEGIDEKNGYIVYDLSNGHWAYEDQLRG